MSHHIGTPRGLGLGALGFCVAGTGAVTLAARDEGPNDRKVMAKAVVSKEQTENLDRPCGRRYRSAMARATMMLFHQEPASPARVAAAARFLDALLQAACPRLPDGAVTLVVSNLSTKASLRPQQDSAARAIGAIRKFLDNPDRAVRRRVQGVERMATVLADHEEIIHGATLRIGRKNTYILDDARTEAMRKLRRAARTPPETTGQTLVNSPVLRVGRTDEAKTIRVRLLIDGEPRDIPIGPKVDPAPFFDAAKHGEEVPITVETAWRRDANGVLRMDVQHTSVIDVGREPTTMTGMEFIEYASKMTPDVFADIDAVLEELEG